MDLVLNNLQRLICHKTQPTNSGDLGSVDFPFIAITLRSTLTESVSIC